MEELKTKFYVQAIIRTYFSDCDMLGHVNNARFITYMEQGRVEYFKNFPEINFVENKADNPYSIILAEITCSYKSPAYMDEILLVQIRTSEIKRSSFIMEYEIIEEKTRRLIATGRSVAVMYDYQQQKSILIPDEIRKRFEIIEKRKF
ncbi:MAG: acyl-CoA thioesterase [Deltaproteobacteria bacterium]|nr:acyl-CoA thioesterase [Deltaproteobacteria bacterium]